MATPPPGIPTLLGLEHYDFKTPPKLEMDIFKKSLHEALSMPTKKATGSPTVFTDMLADDTPMEDPNPYNSPSMTAQASIDAQEKEAYANTVVEHIYQVINYAIEHGMEARRVYMGSETNTLLMHLWPSDWEFKNPGKSDDKKFMGLEVILVQRLRHLEVICDPK